VAVEEKKKKRKKTPVLRYLKGGCERGCVCECGKTGVGREDSRSREKVEGAAVKEKASFLEGPECGKRRGGSKDLGSKKKKKGGELWGVG